MKALRTIGLLAASLFGGAAQAATVLYDNLSWLPYANRIFASDADPRPYGAVGGLRFAPVRASMFYLPEAAAVNQLRWWGNYGFGYEHPLAEGIDNFTVRLFASVSDRIRYPQATPLITHQAGGANRRDTGVEVYRNAGDIYEYHTRLDQTLNLAAGWYALSVVNNTAADADDDWFWVGSNAGGAVIPHLYGELFDGATLPRSWSPQENRVYFQIESAEGAVEPAAAVPLPASSLLALAGLGAMGWLRRR